MSEPKRGQHERHHDPSQPQARHQMLAHGMVIYDALYAACAKAPLTAPGKALGGR